MMPQEQVTESHEESKRGRLRERRPRLVIGLGTGRSGTVSLSRLLDAQAGARVTHEQAPLLAWEGDLVQLAQRLSELCGRAASSLVGDVSFFHLNYVDAIAIAEPDARFICIWRDVDAVVESYFKKVRIGYGETGNHWSLDRTGLVDNKYDSCFPKFPTRDMRQGIRQYCELYHARTSELFERYPDRFLVINVEELNRAAGIDGILEFVGIPRAARIVQFRHDHRNL